MGQKIHICTTFFNEEWKAERSPGEREGLLHSWGEKIFWVLTGVN